MISRAICVKERNSNLKASILISNSQVSSSPKVFYLPLMSFIAVREPDSMWKCKQFIDWANRRPSKIYSEEFRKQGWVRSSNVIRRSSNNFTLRSRSRRPSSSTVEQTPQEASTFSLRLLNGGGVQMKRNCLHLISWVR